MPAENLWRVDIVNAVSDETDENGKKAIWHSINSQVRVDHNMYVIIDVKISHEIMIMSISRKCVFTFSGAIDSRE